MYNAKGGIRISITNFVSKSTDKIKAAATKKTFSQY